MDATRRVTAVLGPTNTGKTHIAVDRKLSGHERHRRVHLAIKDRTEHVRLGRQRHVSFFIARAHALPVQHDRTFAGDHELGYAVEPARHFHTQRLHGGIDHFAHHKSPVRDPHATGNLARIGYFHVMGREAVFLNRIVAALVLLFLTCAATLAQDNAKLDDLFLRLKTAEEGEASRIEREIWIEWSKSGSPAEDLLLQRGKDAMELGDYSAAIEHFTAIIDQDPEFAEAWNARATAFFMAGEFGPAVADVGKVLTLNPRHFGALSGLAMILEESGKPERALEVYKAAIAIHPHLQGASEAIERLQTESEGQEL